MRASRFSFGVADGVVLPPSPVAVARAPAAGSAQAAARVSGGRPRGRAERGVITRFFLFFESILTVRY